MVGERPPRLRAPADRCESPVVCSVGLLLEEKDRLYSVLR